MEFLQQVQDLASKGVAHDEHDLLGFHGTSVEAVKYLAMHGKMPVQGACENEFYFCPKTGKQYLNGPRGEAEKYAGINGVRSYLVGLLKSKGSDLSHGDVMKVAESQSVMHCVFEDQEVVRDKIMGVLECTTIRQLENYYQKLRNRRRGVLLGIRSSVLALGIQKSLDEDLVLITEGLPIDYITGIEPLGDFEWDQILEKNFSDTSLSV